MEIPFNTSALVFIPGNKFGELCESSTDLKEAQGVEYLGYNDGAHRLRVHSGKYKFELKTN